MARVTAEERFSKRLTSTYPRYLAKRCEVCKDDVKKESMWRWKYRCGGNQYLYFCLNCFDPFTGGGHLDRAGDRDVHEFIRAHEYAQWDGPEEITNE